jgi:flagellar motor switch protein FliN/FliY
MPDTAQAPTANEEQQGHDSTVAQDDGKKVAQAAQFPEVQENGVTASGGQFDILLDMDVPVTVVLGTTQIPVRRLLQLGPGAVLKLEKEIEAPVDLFLKDSRFAEADVVVVDDHFAVRIRQITGAGIGAAPTQG